MLKNQKILIIGGTGSLGNALTEKYLPDNDVFIYSRGENAQWIMKSKFNSRNNSKILEFFVGDIRDRERLQTCIFTCKPSIIIIAAALKHVDVCETNVSECINTNVSGVRNVVDLISAHAFTNSIPFLESVLFVSTDKSCAPVNVYGMCKSLSERIMIEKSSLFIKPKMLVVRYGNVLSSNGSLIPLFHNIGKNKDEKNFRITDERMTRFFMTLDDSTALINHALTKGKSGETIIPKHIKSYRIKDIAVMFSKKYNKPIIVSGIRQGEKIHESLISFTEGLRTVEMENVYVIKPLWDCRDVLSNPVGEFTSENVSQFNLDL